MGENGIVFWIDKTINASADQKKVLGIIEFDVDSLINIAHILNKPNIRIVMENDADIIGHVNTHPTGPEPIDALKGWTNKPVKIIPSETPRDKAGNVVKPVGGIAATVLSDWAISNVETAHATARNPVATFVDKNKKPTDPIVTCFYWSSTRDVLDGVKPIILSDVTNKTKAMNMLVAIIATRQP